jgi:hypothetical protein
MKKWMGSCIDSDGVAACCMAGFGVNEEDGIAFNNRSAFRTSAGGP